MKLSRKITQIALALSALPLSAMAGDMGTVYTQFGTNGLGIGYAASVAKDWAVRGQYNTLNLSYTGDVSDVSSTGTADLKIKFSSVQLVGDWYPADSSSFRVTGGVVLNNSKITLDGTGTVNGKPNATVNAEIKMSDSIAPYLGIGYSNRPKDAKGFGFNFDLGVMFQNPKATLAASGAGVVEADRVAQEAKIQDAINNLKTMPVFGLGISYAF
jgi:hypothetical protein